MIARFTETSHATLHDEIRPFAMKPLFLILLCCLCIGYANATTPSTPVVIEITRVDTDLQYAWDGRKIAPKEILPSVLRERYKFGDRITFNILIGDSLPLSALLEVYRTIKEGSVLGDIRFYLVAPRIHGPNQQGEILTDPRGWHELTISPMPNLPAIPPPLPIPSYP